MYVMTLDQRGSSRGEDIVPSTLRRLNELSRRDGLVLRFERTAGDEMQGTLSSPQAVVGVVTATLRADSWRIGIGVGEVTMPLPRSTRAARGTAYVAARAAIEAARTSPQHLSVVGAPGYGGLDMVSFDRAITNAESALWLLTSLLRRRTPDGWQVVDLVNTGMSQREAAEQLEISASAVSQRLRRAGFLEEQRGRDLASSLLALGETA
ncbi:MAG: sigma-70 family RNA polymerase sigma factor [Nocardioidaceae bacterium]|nr:sigma-70 family RNA polymerase sigma factor [Nocardioidaceae bacterium]